MGNKKCKCIVTAGVSVAVGIGGPALVVGATGGLALVAAPFCIGAGLSGSKRCAACCPGGNSVYRFS
jgi:hypothetical protein